MGQLVDQPRSIALLLFIAGLALVALAGLVALGGLSWFGRLPGDLRFEGERVQVFIPVTSVVLVSLVLTLLVHLLRKLF